MRRVAISGPLLRKATQAPILRPVLGLNASSQHTIWTSANPNNRSRVNAFPVCLQNRPHYWQLETRRNIGGPAARVLQYLIVAGTGVLMKAFAQAFQQARRNAGNPAQAAEKIIKKQTIDLREAREILNLEEGEETDLKKINSQYEKYFKSLDPDNGGSFYLQSKVFRAKEALEEEIKTSK